MHAVCRDPSNPCKTSFRGKHTLTHLGRKNTAAGPWNRGSNWPAALRARNVVNDSD